MKKVWITIAVLTAAAALFFIYRNGTTPNVTMTEAGEQLAELYNGTVTKSAERDGQYVYTIEVAKEQYVITVDSETGELQKMIRVSERVKEYKESGIEEEYALREEIDPAKESGPLTEAEAGEIALREVPGTIDEIEMGDEDEAGSFIVDIDLANGDEAIVQVNVISGEIMSISWDD
ncbi:PepSY domain-containing protein [Domibacillus mangrovi]|uniref:PepSY domain-containing protein n=1 Tax=Domibacillus mangrovi TaxID=1714354 RepID=A0A1Q5P4W7_9BACI|nr:PepSY domain-containing protein [Domibacillus mangrovi]OKL37320.1 hypothetical protein BLL40_07020 [Domibacillus mangrovi]